MAPPLLVPLAMIVARHIVKKGVTSALKTYKNRMSTAAIKQIGKRTKEQMDIVKQGNARIKVAQKVVKVAQKDKENFIARGKPFKKTDTKFGAEGRKALREAKDRGELPESMTPKKAVALSLKKPDTKPFSYHLANKRIKKALYVGLPVAGYMIGKSSNDNQTSQNTKPTFKQAFNKARTNNQKTFQWQDKSGKVKRYTTEIAEEQRKKFQAAGRGAGTTRLGGNK